MKVEWFLGARPVYAWAVLHACWIHNRFSVKNGSSPFEICSGRMYTGKLAHNGERVLGYLKTELKGKPQWRAGIWIGKTTHFSSGRWCFRDKVDSQIAQRF